MSDSEQVENQQVEESTTGTQSAAPSVSETPDETGDLRNQLNHWREMARKNESRAKENADAAKRLAEIEDAQKSATEKLTEERDKLAVELTEYRVRDIRTQAAIDAGLGAAWAGQIKSVDEESAAAEAKNLVDLIKSQAPAAAPQEPLYTQGYQGKGEKRGASVSGGRDMYAERHKK